MTQKLILFVHRLLLGVVLLIAPSLTLAFDVDVGKTLVEIEDASGQVVWTYGDPVMGGYSFPIVETGYTATFIIDIDTNGDLTASSFQTEDFFDSTVFGTPTYRPESNISISGNILSAVAGNARDDVIGGEIDPFTLDGDRYDVLVSMPIIALAPSKGAYYCNYVEFPRTGNTTSYIYNHGSAPDIGIDYNPLIHDYDCVEHSDGRPRISPATTKTVIGITDLNNVSKWNYGDFHPGTFPEVESGDIVSFLIDVDGEIDRNGLEYQDIFDPTLWKFIDFSFTEDDVTATTSTGSVQLTANPAATDGNTSTPSNSYGDPTNQLAPDDDGYDVVVRLQLRKANGDYFCNHVEIPKLTVAPTYSYDHSGFSDLISPTNYPYDCVQNAGLRADYSIEKKVVRIFDSNGNTKWDFETSDPSVLPEVAETDSVYFLIDVDGEIDPNGIDYKDVFDATVWEVVGFPIHETDISNFSVAGFAGLDYNPLATDNDISTPQNDWGDETDLLMPDDDGYDAIIELKLIKADGDYFCNHIEYPIVKPIPAYTYDHTVLPDLIEPTGYPYACVQLEEAPIESPVEKKVILISDSNDNVRWTYGDPVGPNGFPYAEPGDIIRFAIDMDGTPGVDLPVTDFFTSPFDSTFFVGNQLEYRDLHNTNALALEIISLAGSHDSWYSRIWREIQSYGFDFQQSPITSTNGDFLGDENLGYIGSDGDVYDGFFEYELQDVPGQFFCNHLEYPPVATPPTYTHDHSVFPNLTDGHDYIYDCVERAPMTYTVEKKWKQTEGVDGSIVETNAAINSPTIEAGQVAWFVIDIDGQIPTAGLSIGDLYDTAVWENPVFIVEDNVQLNATTSVNGNHIFDLTYNAFANDGTAGAPLNEYGDVSTVFGPGNEDDDAYDIVIGLTAKSITDETVKLICNTAHYPSSALSPTYDHAVSPDIVAFDSATMNEACLEYRVTDFTVEKTLRKVSADADNNGVPDAWIDCTTSPSECTSVTPGDFALYLIEIGVSNSLPIPSQVIMYDVFDPTLLSYQQTYSDDFPTTAYSNVTGPTTHPTSPTLDYVEILMGDGGTGNPPGKVTVEFQIQ